MLLRRLSALALVCALGLAGAAVEVHELDARHVRCEVHGGWRHDEAPDDAPGDVHTDDHRDLKFFAAALTPPFTPLPTPRQQSAWAAACAPVITPRAQHKVWATAPKGSPPPA